MLTWAPRLPHLQLHVSGLIRELNLSEERPSRREAVRVARRAGRPWRLISRAPLALQEHVGVEGDVSHDSVGR